MIIFTEAPVEYDYNTTNEVARLIFDRRDKSRNREPRVLRVVDVVGENDDRTEFLTNYQADRYRSGLYFTSRDPDDAGTFLQLNGGPGVAALLRGYATVARLCDECGDELDPTFDPPGARCGSCRAADDRSLRDFGCHHCGAEDARNCTCENFLQGDDTYTDPAEPARRVMGQCHICGEDYGDRILCACEQEARADANQ